MIRLGHIAEAKLNTSPWYLLVTMVPACHHGTCLSGIMVKAKTIYLYE